MGNLVTATVVTKDRRDWRQQLGQDPAFVVHRFSYRIIWAKDEHILLARVPMKVEIHIDREIFAYFRYKCFQSWYFWEQCLIFRSELSIEILSRCSCSRVSEGHSVWVQHRNDNDYESSLNRMYFSLRYLISSFMQSYFIRREIINELLDSLGWTLPVINSTGFLFCSASLPKHTYGMLSPVRLWPIQPISIFFGSFFRSDNKSLYV